MASSIIERVIAGAIRRGRKAKGGLPLLKRLAGGDIVLPDKVTNRILRTAALDDDLPFRLDRFEIRTFSGYAEVCAQGSFLLTGPSVRIQFRPEYLVASLSEQTLRLRLLRDIQGFPEGVVQQVLWLFVRAIFGRLLFPEELVSALSKSGPGFTAIEPNLLEVKLHEIPAVEKQLSSLWAGAAKAVVGRDTELLRGIRCEEGQLVIQTTTVAREVSGRLTELGAGAGFVAEKVAGKVSRVGRKVLDELKKDSDEDTD